MDPRAFFSWVFFALSEQGPNLGASTYLANCLEMVELEEGWAQVPVTSRSRGSPHSGRIAPALCSTALCLSACHFFFVTCVCGLAHCLLPRHGQGLASFSLSPVLFGSPGSD